MSNVTRFVAERMSGERRPDTFVLWRDNGSATVVLDSFPVKEGVDRDIEAAIKEDLSETSGSVEYMVQAQTRAGEAIASRTFKRKGLAPPDAGGRTDSRLVDLVHNTLERTAVIQSGIYDRMSVMLDRNERIILEQNKTIRELATTCSEAMGSEQDPGQKFAMERLESVAGKALPILSAMMSRKGDAPVEPSTSGRYAELRSAVAAFTDSDIESIGIWLKDSGTGPDILARLCEESRDRIITAITKGDL